jgi:CubicO group peptidase (beta-lactamase class C family)
MIAKVKSAMGRRGMRGQVLLGVLLIAAGGGDAAARADPHREEAHRIDAVLAPHIPTREANGTVLVFRNGAQIYRRDIGMADFGRRIPIGSRTQFRIASISKTVTGGAAMALRAEQRLRFPAAVADYLPGFPRGRDIRVFHLLTHASGLGDVPDPPAGHAYHRIREAVDSFRAAPLAFEPGSHSRYSNAGYVLAARLIEIASGMPYDDFIRSRFFAPLGMSSAADDWNGAPTRDRAIFYCPGPGRDGVLPAPLVDMSPVVGAGALRMTARDLMRWLEAVRTNRFFNLWTGEYPFGWGKRTWFGLNAVEQSGRNEGYGSSAAIIPDRQLSVLCLSNVQSGFSLRCASEVAAAVLDQPSPEPSFRLDLPRARFTPALGRAFAGRYVGDHWHLDIASRDGGLFYRFAEHWLPVTPSTGNRLLLIPDSAIVTARVGADGRIEALTYRDGRQETVLTREPAA